MDISAFHQQTPINLHFFPYLHRHLYGIYFPQNYLHRHLQHTTNEGNDRHLHYLSAKQQIVSRYFLVLIFTATLLLCRQFSKNIPKTPLNSTQERNETGNYGAVLQGKTKSQPCSRKTAKIGRKSARCAGTFGKYRKIKVLRSGCNSPETFEYQRGICQ